MSDWLFAAALRLVPASWRASVRADIDEDARAQGRGDLWKAWQAARVAFRWRSSLAGGAMLTDLRYVVRSLLAAKWFTAGAVLTFALGIGVNIAVFSAIDRLFFRSLPYADPAALVLLRWCNPQTGECASGSFPSTVAFELQEHSSTLADIAVAGPVRSYATSRDAGAEDALKLYDVSPRTLKVLGVSPVVGRDISEAEVASKARVGWISEEAWRSRLQADPNVVGRTLWLGEQAVSVIGVLPKGFIPPAWSSVDPKWAGLVVGYDSWSTIQPTGAIHAPFARMKPGVTPAAVQQELAAVVQGLAVVPGRSAQSRSHLRADPIQSSLFSRFRQYLWLVVAATGLVLLMACANLASLLVARSRSREHHAALATALGASRARVVVTAMTESAVVCLAGAALAIGAVAASERVLASVLPPLLNRYAVGVTDLRVLAFALIASCVAAIVAGVGPGWRMTKVDVLSTLQKGTRGGGRASSRAARGLLVAEAAIGSMLVLGSVLAVRSFTTLASDDLGYQPERLSILYVTGKNRAPFDEQRLRIEAALEVVKSATGVAAVGAADGLPTEFPERLFKKGDVEGSKIQITADYFATLGAEVLAGRTFYAAEVAARADVVILNRLAATLLFPGATPAGTVGRMWQADGEPLRQVVGVVQDFKSRYGDERTRPALFLPIGTEPTSWGALVVRALPGALLRPDELRALVRGRIGDVGVTLSNIPQTLDAGLQDPRFRALLLTVLALTGLLVAVVGLYAVASYDASLRVHEMGVRLSLGATPSVLKRLVLWQACWPVLIGVAIGLTGAYWMAKFAQAFLYKLDGRDPLTYALVAAVLIATALVAAWLPARRAAATDPAVVLKAQ